MPPVSYSYINVAGHAHGKALGALGTAHYFDDTYNPSNDIFGYVVLNLYNNPGTAY
ncbi:hypothetical protein MNB_SM-4-1824 [hydrothermal vent metagenome]|uniref:Uncharacterized protein n=1 Tax=hydrothermal vent metagenome TaxID=652676 RepID=A0A1W1CAW2_9ZZZZ